MKDEIKEILYNFKIYEDRYKKCNETQFIIFYRDIHLLLDYISNLQDYKSRNEKANWWLKEMLKQAKSDETKAIINGTLELLLNGGDEE